MMPAAKDDVRRIRELYKAGDMKGVEALIRRGVDLNAYDEYGDTILHEAIGNEDLVKVLIQAGADVNVQNIYGATPLHCCARVDNVQEEFVTGSVAHLLAAGAATNVLDQTGMAPLHLAAERGNYNIMRQLLENDNDPADANVPDSNGATPLFYATRSVKATRLLIEFGADVNARDAHGNTPVIGAAVDWRTNDRLGVVRTLLEAGADANATADDGESALHLYFHAESERLVRLLINRGADVNASNGICTPLHCAARGDSVESIRLLLKHGADPHARCQKKSWTPLHYAVQNRDPHEAVQLLVKTGVDVNAVDNEGSTPMHALIEHHPKINWTSDDRIIETLDTARLLMENGADMNAVRNDGATPLFAAYEATLYRVSPRSRNDTFDEAQEFYDEKIRPLWPELVRMGARLDVVALVHDIEWWDKLPSDMQFDQSKVFFTFVHFAVLFNDYDLLEAAIAQRADLDVRSYLFGSALHIACDKGDRKMAQVLLRNGAHTDSVPLPCLAA